MKTPHTSRHTPAAAEGTRGALAALSLTMVLPTLGLSIATVALPTLEAAFAAPVQQVQWVVIAYLVIITAAIVGAGRLGDIAGRRQSMLAGIALFTAASAMAGVAPDLWFLVAARALQGLGAAVMMALTLAFVGEVVPKARTGRVMGVLGTMSAVGTASGPALGGLLLAEFGWPAIFLVALPLGALALLLAARHLPPGRALPQSERRGFDTWGTLLLALTLGAYTLAMTLGRGGFGVVNMALLTAAGAGAALFVLVEAKADAPLLRLSLFRDPVLSAGLAMGVAMSTVVMATLVVGPFYLSRTLGLDTTATGLVLAVGPVVAALTSAPAGIAVDRFGAVPVTVFGLATAASGAALLSVIPPALGIAGYCAPLAVLTSGYALFQTANNTAVMAGVRQDQRGLVSGMLNLSRNVGLVTGASVMAALFAAAAATDDPAAAALPEAVAAGMRSTFAVATGLLVAAILVALGSRAAVARASRSGDAP